MDNKTIPETIRDQIGQQALFMIGTKHLVGADRSLAIRISCRGAKANLITITLNGLDLYDMKFEKMWGGKFKLIGEESNVYCEDLNKMIETHTGLCTHL